MKVNLEKTCIGFLIGILLFCVCNKMFLIEGVGEGVGGGGERCAWGQLCHDMTPCGNIDDCAPPHDACICPGGGGPPPPSSEEICNDLIPKWCMKDDNDVPYGCADPVPARPAEYKGKGRYLCSTIYKDMGTCESEGQGNYIWCPPKNDLRPSGSVPST